jgi:hypothetical protein
MIRIDFNVDRQDLYHFGWMLLFILGVYVFANYIVMKDLDQYIEMKNRYSFQKTLQNYVQENAQNAQMKYADYKSYESYLTNMHQTFDKESLVSLLSGYFQKVKIEFIEEKKQDGVDVQRFVVTATMESPRSFFDLLQDIGRKSLPIKVEMPVQFEKNGAINASFELLVYTLQ